MVKFVMRGAALAAALAVSAPMVIGLSAPAAWAKTATVNDITLDMPDGFTIESSERGILAKTPDGEVDVWVETYMPPEEDTLIAEHEKYWKSEKVVLGDGAQRTVEGQIPMKIITFEKATWKGDPTIVRYNAIGPVGPKKEMVLVTYWASPEGDKEYFEKIGKMLDTLNVKIAQ